MAARQGMHWSRAKRTAFLDHLAGSCNVRESAAAAGVAPVSIYELRRKDARFAAEWHEALLAGYQLLETELLGYALAGGTETQDIAGATRRIDVDIALKLLGQHRTGLLGQRRPKPLTKRATSEETDRAILKKLDALDRARKRRDGPAQV